MDVRYGRNAGQLIKQKTAQGSDALIRVSQDGTERYGARLHFHSITDISPDAYAETYVGTRNPPERYDGTHHYSRSARWETIDVSLDSDMLQSGGQS